MKFADIIVPNGRKYPNISLAKLCGKTIADIEVSLTTEFGQVNVQLRDIIFEDGSTLSCEGEHDLPYVTEGNGGVLPDEEALDALHDEQDAYYEGV